MQPEALEELYENYSDFLVNEKGQRCIIECGDGWLKLITDLCEKLEHLNVEKDIKRQIKIESIRERFGVMRTVFRSTHDGILDLKLANIAYSYEVKSNIVCVICGAPAKPSSGKILKSLCAAHTAKE